MEETDAMASSTSTGKSATRNFKPISFGVFAEAAGLSELRNVPQHELGLQNTPFEDNLIGGGTARGSAGLSLSRSCFSAPNI